MLLRGVGQAGLHVELDVVGDPLELPAGLDLAAYRIVQEALTNSLKHAGADQAWVSIRYGAHDLLLEISDDGQAGANGNGTGHGLVGMRERVALYGGELQTSRPPAGGFVITANLPLSPAT